MKGGGGWAGGELGALQPVQGAVLSGGGCRTKEPLRSLGKIIFPLGRGRDLDPSLRGEATHGPGSSRSTLPHGRETPPPLPILIQPPFLSSAVTCLVPGTHSAQLLVMHAIEMVALCQEHDSRPRQVEGSFRAWKHPSSMLGCNLEAPGHPSTVSKSLNMTLPLYLDLPSAPHTLA